MLSTHDISRIARFCCTVGEVAYELVLSFSLSNSPGPAPGSY